LIKKSVCFLKQRPGKEIFQPYDQYLNSSRSAREDLGHIRGAEKKIYLNTYFLNTRISVKR